MWDYVDDVVTTGDVVAGTYVKKACTRMISYLSNEDWELKFDFNEAARYINFIERVCVHTRGEY